MALFLLAPSLSSQWFKCFRQFWVILCNSISFYFTFRSFSLSIHSYIFQSVCQEWLFAFLARLTFYYLLRFLPSQHRRLRQRSKLRKVATVVRCSFFGFWDFGSLGHKNIGCCTVFRSKHMLIVFQLLVFFALLFSTAAFFCFISELFLLSFKCYGADLYFWELEDLQNSTSIELDGDDDDDDGDKETDDRQSSTTCHIEVLNMNHITLLLGWWRLWWMGIWFNIVLHGTEGNLPITLQTIMNDMVSTSGKHVVII